MANKMVVGLVSVLVVVVLLGCVLVPAIDSMDMGSRTTITLDNTGTKMISGKINDEYTFSLEKESISSVFSSDNTTWAITTDGKLYGCGDNSKGQQGDGTTTNVTTFTQRLETETIASVSCSSGTTWAVTTDGKLYGCGSAASGQQGSGTTTNVTTFTQRLDTETIASVNAGLSGSTTWVVTTDGKLYGCGSGSNGQQGSGTTTNVTTFTQRLDTETIASVSSASSSTWAVTTDGKLYGCGYNNRSQQGSGNTTDVTTFTQRLDTETIASVAATGDTTWAVTTDGKLYGCGYNNYGQQGGGSTTVSLFTQRLDTETIASVNARVNGHTTWAITTDGKLYGCGDNSKGQQGGGLTIVSSFTQRLDDGAVTHSFYNNDVEITLSGITKDGYTFLVGGNDWAICLEGADYVLYYAGLSDKVTLSGTVSLIFINGSMTIEGEGSPTMTYSSLFYEGNGDYVMMGESAYLNSDSLLLGFAFPTNDSGIEVSGTYSSPAAVSIADGSITVGSGSVTTTATEHEGVVSLTAVSSTYDTDQTANCSFVIVPDKVTYTEITENEAIKGLLSAIPLIVIASLIVAMAAIMIYRRE